MSQIPQQQPTVFGQEPARRSSGNRPLIIGCVGCLGVLVIGVVLVVVGLIWFGTRSTLSVQTGTSMPSADLQAIVDAGLIEPDEVIVQIYTTGVVDFRSDGFFFTDRRVVQYGDVSDPLTHLSATYDLVVDIELLEAQNFFDDSMIVVTLHDGSEIIGFVNHLEAEDRKFYDALVAAWGDANEEP